MRQGREESVEEDRAESAEGHRVSWSSASLPLVKSSPSFSFPIVPRLCSPIAGTPAGRAARPAGRAGPAASQFRNGGSVAGPGPRRRGRRLAESDSVTREPRRVGVTRVTPGRGS
eukprot:756996-Hanusia_phi.AAC.1